MYNFKKIISLAIVLMMVISVMPMVVSADNPEFAAPTQRFFETFDVGTEVPASIVASSGAEGGLSITEEGKLRMIRANTSDNSVRMSIYNLPAQNPIVVEYCQAATGYRTKYGFNLFPNEASGSSNRKSIWSGGERVELNGTKYMIFDPATGTATHYGDDFVADTPVTGISQTAEEFGFGIWGTIATENSYFDWDYIAVYDYTPMSIKLEDITDANATLKTTLPVDVLNSTLSIGETSATLTKVENSYNTYTVTFGSKLSWETAYTLSGNLAYLGSAEPYAVSYEFTTPVKTYMAPAEHYFNDFEDLTEVPGEYSPISNGALAVEDGKLILKRGAGLKSDGTAMSSNEKQQVRANIVTTVPVGGNPIVFETQVALTSRSNTAEGVYISGKKGYSLSGPTDGTRYLIYYPETGTADLYREGEEKATATELSVNPASISYRLHCSSSDSARYFKYDYIAVYDLDSEMAIKLEDITTTGATLKTTAPVDVLNSTLNIAGATAVLTKVANSYNTYAVTFDSALASENAYTLSGSLAYFGGTEPYTVSYGFETPVKTYSAPTQRYFNNFEGLTEVPAGISGQADGTVEMVDGKLRLGRDGGYDARVLIHTIGINVKKPIVIEYEHEGHGSVKESVRFYQNTTTALADNRLTIYRDTEDLRDPKGVRYFVVDAGKGKATAYGYGFTELSTVDIDQTGSTFTLAFWNNLEAAGEYYDYDYVAAYDLDNEMAIKLEDVTIGGATLKTTIPVDVNTAALNIGEIPVTLTKVPDTYNTYKLRFRAKLNELSDYTLSGSLSYLTGTTPYTVNYAFETPEKSFADFKPYEYYLEDFEGITEIPENIVATQNGVISLNNGKINLTTNGEKINDINYDCRMSVTNIPLVDEKVIIELGQSGKGYGIENDFYFLSNGVSSSANRASVYKNDSVLNEAKYILYDPALNTATPYINGLTAGETVECKEQTEDKIGIGLWATINSTSKYIEYDYIAVYELASEFMYEIEEVSTLGAVINTTMPIDMAASQFSLGGIGVKIEKAPDTYNKYYLTFNKEILSTGNYTLTGKIAYFGGSDEVAVSYTFENPVKPLTFTNLAVDESDGVKATVTATNLSQGRGYDVFLIIAAYNSEGEYIGVNLEKITVAANVENEVYVADAPEIENAASYRAFLWKLQLVPFSISQ